MEWPERRRREGQRSVRFAFGRRSSLFCVPVLFLYLLLLWVHMFFWFYVGPAKLQRGATPPSVMVLLSCHRNIRWRSGKAEEGWRHLQEVVNSKEEEVGIFFWKLKSSAESLDLILKVEIFFWKLKYSAESRNLLLKVGIFFCKDRLGQEGRTNWQIHLCFMSNVASIG